MTVLNGASIRAISFDVTGTLVVHTTAVAEAYAQCARWAQLRDPPTAEELRPAFKKAYREASATKPSFGHYDGKGDRAWWKYAVRLTMEYAGRDYDDDEFERCFRRIYQHYGSPRGYSELADVRGCLDALTDRGLVLGVTSNTASRTVETTLPLLGLHTYFHWFACSEDVGADKPEKKMFDASVGLAKFWCPDLAPHEVLHVGDNFAVDFCGARAAGLQALYLDRKGGTTNFQDWVVGPEYPGKCDDDVRDHTIHTLAAIIPILDDDDNPLIVNKKK
ncbi:hypothetical protein CTAYLR_005501 [Chrysophaeum taylorii]|uniref:Haloacid dehalogenase-like hydrolase domain-containing protein 3 n=1 Tax=Chrysophaeum taylorii TaxID=2483200 RepID=A0AAD7U6S3_9STRA|nr:hypothetical protein CTAYLR_005501 [Chrysophaeum taylorii]